MEKQHLRDHKGYGKKNCDIMWEQKNSTPLSTILEFLPVEL